MNEEENYIQEHRIKHLWLASKEKNLDEVEKLAIWEVACLMYGDPDVEKIKKSMFDIRISCQELFIKCEGSPWPRIEKQPLEHGATKPIVKVINGKETLVNNEPLFFTKKLFSGYEATLNKDVVRQYLEQFNLWPIDSNVPLSKWWMDKKTCISKIKEELVPDNDDSNKGKIYKTDKVLIELQRNTTELITLIYKIFETYDFKVGVDIEKKLPAKQAWGLVISGKFTDDLIATVNGQRKVATIKLNGGDEVNWEQFKRTYSRRFK